MSKEINYSIGDVFGKRTIVDHAEPYPKSGGIRVKVKCECGKEDIVGLSSLLSGRAQMCKSCSAKLAQRKIGKIGITHESWYILWQRMKAQCENPNNPQYKNFGGIGIKVCDEWHNSSVFGEWAMSHGYENGLQLSRLDDTRDFCPENCEWKPSQIKTIVWQGKSLFDACKDYNVAYKTAWFRLHKGYSIFEALYGIRHKFRKDDSDLVGKKINNLTVLNIDRSESLGEHISYVCQCDCGRITVVDKFRLIHGLAKTCKICSRYPNRARSMHGMKNTQFYNKYHGILDRCNNPKCDSYPLYGGRGIKCHWVCFDDFKSDMYESYLEHVKEYGKHKTTIERIDSDGDYCKENCRWATPKEQARNTRNTTIVEYHELILSLADICDCFNLKREAVRKWLKTHKDEGTFSQLFDRYLCMKGL